MSKYSTSLSDKDKDFLRAQFGKTYEHIAEGARILDVGCSTGYYGGFLKTDKQCVVYGIDINGEDLEKASKVLDKTFLVNLDKTELPRGLTNTKFDVIFFGDVIEHVLDPEEILLRFKPLLSKGGFFIISVPNIAHLSIRLELMTGNFDYEPLGILDETHTKYFTYKSLQRLMRRVGCNIELVDYSEADIPNSIVSEWLGKVGLTPTDKFFKTVVESPASKAFQYKIIAKPASSKNLAKAPELEVKPLLKKQQDEQAAIKEAQTEIEKQKAEISSLRSSLATMSNSASWKITKPLRMARSIARKLTKGSPNR